jgi:hypothetical protein
VPSQPQLYPVPHPTPWDLGSWVCQGLALGLGGFCSGQQGTPKSPSVVVLYTTQGTDKRAQGFLALLKASARMFARCRGAELIANEMEFVFLALWGVFIIRKYLWSL